MTFTFDVKGNRELPLIVGQLNVILPKHYWEGKDANGEPRDITKSTLEPPVGSGPYRVKEFDAGRSITYERVKDYWAKDLPVVKGQWNFDEITLRLFPRPHAGASRRSRPAQIDSGSRTVAKDWATALRLSTPSRRGW